ncbi:BTAD domain-containing putative transcriptional regulator [Streptomyces sp. NPDC005865]|uniref:AfsR/SARP family transcriptional regulator n=1 Tax=Streptomyces sp. NPDC005865 TaxID=3155453 RepID=UPI0033ECEA64
MRARLLGPFELAVGDRPVQLTGRQRGLSAALLLDANRPVSVETLERRLWGETPPATSAARLRALVTEVRRALGPDARAAIETRPSGYVFRIDPHHVDIIGFETHTAAGISALAHEDWSLALRRFDSALALWRGAPLQDLPTVPEKQRLIALRDTSVEARWEAAIECGQAGTAVAELTQLTREHPLRERPHALLMRALHREGRTAEGLEVYRKLRGRLVDELAVEPSAETAALHGALLSGLPSPSRAAAPETAAPKTATDKAVRVPRQLPLSTHHFGGRDTELAQLDAALDRSEKLIVLAGAAGAGKTALAVSWAHRVADRFPDGQLFLDLRGFDRAGPMPVEEALPIMLQGLGCPAPEIPVSTDGQTALLRTLLADRRVLIVLDDAAAPKQVRPLCPGVSESLVLVTSRDRLSGLTAGVGAHRITCEMLSPDDAYAYLERVVGTERVACESAAAGQLVELSGRLPLALCIAASRIAEQPGGSIAQYVKELSDRGRLTRLRVEGDSDLAVRAALDLTYSKLPPAAQVAFRRLGAVASTGRSTAAVAAGAAMTRDEAEDALMAAARVHLVREVGGGRFAWHDLVHEFAAAHLHEDDPPGEARAASRRVLDHYLHGCFHAVQACGLRTARTPLGPPADHADPPAFADRADALAWFDQEWEDLAAAISHAAKHGPARAAWQLVATLHDLLQRRRSLAEWIRLAELAVQAAEREDDLLGCASMRLALGAARWRAADLPGSLAEYGAARHLARQVEWPYGEAVALQGIGVQTKQLGRPREALVYYRQAVALFKVVGRVSDQAAALSNIGSAYLVLGEPEKAGQALDEALPLACGTPHFHALVLVNRGLVCQRLGRLDEAESVLSEALKTASAADSDYARAISLETLAMVHADAGRSAQAAEMFTRALEIADQVENDNCRTACLVGLAAVDRADGRLEESAAHLARARRIVERTGETIGRTTVSWGTGEWHLANRDPEAALREAAKAETVALKGAQFLLARLRLLTARSHQALGALEQAREAAEDARRLARASGERLVHESALHVIASIDAP